MEPSGQDALKLYPINHSIKNATVSKFLAYCLHSLITAESQSRPITATEKTKLNLISNAQTLAVTLLLSNTSESLPKHVTPSAVNLTEYGIIRNTSL